MCWFKSNSKKELGIFFSSRRQAEPGAERAPGSFLVYAENAREKVGIFFSPSLQSRASTRKSVMSRVMRKIDFGIWQKSITEGGLTALWLLFSRQGAKGQGRRYAARLALDAL